MGYPDYHPDRVGEKMREEGPPRVFEMQSIEIIHQGYGLNLESEIQRFVDRIPLYRESKKGTKRKAAGIRAS